MCDVGAGWSNGEGGEWCGGAVRCERVGSSGVEGGGGDGRN